MTENLDTLQALVTNLNFCASIKKMFLNNAKIFIFVSSKYYSLYFLQKLIHCNLKLYRN